MPRETLEQILLCRYRKPNQYFQSWNELKHLSSWLDPNLMLQISLNGGTNGHRGLGRLAFFENYRRILSRLRCEIEFLKDPTRIQSSPLSGGRALRTDETAHLHCHVDGRRFGLRDVSRPLPSRASSSFGDWIEFSGRARIFGGSLSIWKDIKRSSPYQQLRAAQNILDFSQPDALFSADYEGNGNVHHFTGPPCNAFYYFDAEANSVPEPRLQAIEDVVGDVVIQTAMSVIGKRLDQEEKQSRWPHHRSIGIFSLTYPQRRLLRTTSARICRNMVEQW